MSATVAANCFVSASNLNFGSFDGTADVTATSVIDVRCTTGSTYTLKLDAGNGTFDQRLLSAGGSETLQYNLFSDAALTSVWGDGTASTSTVSRFGNGLADAATVAADDGQAETVTAPEGKLDLEDLAREQLYLSLPLKPICIPTCKGLCPTCGANRNQGDCGGASDDVDPRLAPLLPFRRKVQDS